MMMVSVTVLCLLPIFFRFVPSAHAFKGFQIECSTPKDHVTWVSPPNVRGTMDIIFSCFSVLLICTWAIQHLSIPPHKTHLWNHRIVKSRQYSAFLDDARFNYTKSKWMLTSILVPEFVLSKALSELLAAHDSRKEFVKLRDSNSLPRDSNEPSGDGNATEQSDSRDWSTTHAYFANMGGFILRFHTEAVKLPMEPHVPDEHERSLFKLNPGADSPYVPQDHAQTEARELQQCLGGKPCKNHPNVGIVRTDGDDEDVALAPDDLSPTQTSQNESHPLLEVVINSHVKANSIDRRQMPVSPQASPTPSSEDFTALTPATLISQPLLTPISPPNTVVNRHAFPKVDTPTAISNEPHFPFPNNGRSDVDSSDHGVHKINTTVAPNLNEAHRPIISAINCTMKRPIPHTTWQANWPLNSMQMMYAIREGIIPVPATTAEELNDRSKGDALVKGLAVIHITWLVIQTLARSVDNLAITQLEIMVLGFSACAIVTYFLLWHKPQDVKVPTYIDLPKPLTRKQIIQLAARSPVATLMVKQFWLHGVAIRAMAENVFPWTPGIKFRLPYLMKEPVFLVPHLVGIGGGGAIFGGIHIAAWNFAFPTYIEQLLWRISATYLAVIPLIGIIIYCFAQHFARNEDKMTDTKTDKVLRPIGRVAIPLYLLARLYLLVEVFRCLAYSPPTAFQNVAWPSVIPHIN